MPRIPRYEGDARITSAAPATTIDPGVYALEGNAQAKMGQAVIGVADDLQKVNNALYKKFNDLNNLNQHNEAMLSASRSIQAIKAEADKDPDLYNNYGKYESRIKSIADNSAQNIQDPETRSRAMFSIQAHADAQLTQLTSDSRKKLLDKYKVDLFNQIDMNKIAYGQVADPAQRKAIIDQTRGLINQGLQNDYLSVDNAIKLREGLEKDFNVDLFDARLDENPEQFLADLNSGVYEIEDASMRQEYEQKAIKKVDQKREAGIKLMAEQTYTQESDAVGLLANNQLLPAQVTQLGATGAIEDPELIKALEEASLSKNTSFVNQNFKSKPGVFSRILVNSLNAVVVNDENPESSARKKGRAVMLEAVRAFGNGEISDHELRKIHGIVGGTFQSAENQERNAWYKGIAKFFNGAGARIQEASGQVVAMSQSAATQFSKFIEKVNKEGLNSWGDFQKAAVQVKKDSIKEDHPSTIALDDVPNSTMSAEGGFKAIYSGNSQVKPDFRALPEDTDYTIMLRPKDGKPYKISKGKVKEALASGWKHQGE